MIQANVHEAKTRLSQLIERAEAGEEVVIARNGKPAVRLQPIESPASRPREWLGMFAHKMPEPLTPEGAEISDRAVAALFGPDYFADEPSDPSR